MPSRTAPPISTSKAQGGVLPISAVTDKNDSHVSEIAENASGKTSSHRLKVIVRRLPPGLTENEFYTALGSEWRSGKGIVTWASFRKGKISKELAKPSRPARAYLHIADQGQLDALSRKIAQATFTDARSSASDSVLIGPPSLEFAPYGRIPGGKRRHDARQGTIDQDPEFIEFLESLTNPITKPKALDVIESQKEKQVNVTPLIQYLRDKKAAKEKAANIKAAAKHQKQDVKAESPGNNSKARAAASVKESQVGKRAGTAAKAADKLTKDAVRSPPRKEKPGTSPRPQNASPAKATTSARSETTDKRSDGPSPGSAAARMIQRDLGLKGARGPPAKAPRADRQTSEAPSTVYDGSGRNGTPQDFASGSTNRKSTTQLAAGLTNAIPKAPRSALARIAATSSQPLAAGKQPLTRSKSPAGPKVAPPAAIRLSKAANIDPTATRAFLKHANPSQGITEALLEVALAPLGKISRVEIDKRKGFAYVDFTDPSGLQAAVSASPIAVAQGSVQVLERKDRGSASAVSAPPAVASQSMPIRGGRGGSGAGIRGSMRGGRGRGAAFEGRGAVGRPPATDKSGQAAVTSTTKPTSNATPEKKPQ